jgi:hypothetical protein
MSGNKIEEIGGSSRGMYICNTADISELSEIAGEGLRSLRRWVDMPANVFVSYDHDDEKQVGGFKALKSNPNHPLDFHDRSLKEPVKDRSGKPIKYPPSDPRSKPVRDEIRTKFEKCSKLVVLIGDDTHKSEWVEWEINSFFEMKKELSGEKTWKRIRGMTLKGSDNAIIPKALYGGRSTQWLAWDPEALDRWLDQDPSA